MTERIIQTENLTKAYGQRIAVDSLSLEVSRGDVFGFLGPNGAGKTTTIRMLLGLIRPTAGRACLFGQDTRTELPAILHRLGAIIETPVFYPYLSGRDNLRVLAAASGVDVGQSREKRIDGVLELVDLRRQADDPYQAYSLGMRERLGIGAALLANPELILLDEPTNGLDPAGVHEIRQLIPALASQGKTIFLTSHLLYEIQQVCNRVAVLVKGKLLRQGRVSDLLQEGDQWQVRMNTPFEAKLAWQVLERARSDGSSWIDSVRLGDDNSENRILQVQMSLQRSSQITALLAHEQLYVAELVPYRTSLEDYFLQLTGEAEQNNPHFSMAL